MSNVPVLFLDLDGTVRQSVDDPLGKFVNAPEDVVVFPEAVTQMRAWKEQGGRIVACSNQGGVALGYMTADACAAAMEETNRQCEKLFDAMVWCTHHPDAKELAQGRCGCRKPRSGMTDIARCLLEEQFADDFPAYMGLFVGDMDKDQECAAAASLDFMWAKDWRAGEWMTEYRLEMFKTA